MNPTTPSSKAGALIDSALEELDGALRKSHRSIAIASPFMSLPVADQLIRAADEGRAAKRRLITAINDAAVAGGYLDPRAIEAFVGAGFDVRSLRNLHAKVVLVDDSWGVLGSGNLTAAGLGGGNAELGIVLSRTQTIAAEKEHFASWWRAAKPVDLKRLRAVERRRRPRDPPETPTRRPGRDLEAAEPAEALAPSEAARDGGILAQDHVRPPRPPSGVVLAWWGLGQRSAHVRHERVSSGSADVRDRRPPGRLSDPGRAQRLPSDLEGHGGTGLR